MNGRTDEDAYARLEGVWLWDLNPGVKDGDGERGGGAEGW